VKKYEVEFASTTYREYTVEARNKEEAKEKAFHVLNNDDEVSRAWKENAVASDVDVLYEN